MKPDFNKGGGLLPTVVQDNTTKAVLMVAWMNEESFHKTLETKGNLVLVSFSPRTMGIKAVQVAMYNMWWI